MVLTRLLNIFRPPTTEESRPFFESVKQTSPTITNEISATANAVWKTLVQTTGTVVKSPLTVTRGIVSAAGNILALPSIALHYLARGLDVAEANVIDTTRDKLANVFTWRGGKGGKPAA